VQQDSTDGGFHRCKHPDYLLTSTHLLPLKK
jgi:hypothetical protein